MNKSIKIAVVLQLDVSLLPILFADGLIILVLRKVPEHLDTFGMDCDINTIPPPILYFYVFLRWMKLSLPFLKCLKGGHLIFLNRTYLLT